MPAGARPRRETTDAGAQLRLLVTSPEQEASALLRPIVLFGQPAAARARETGVTERTLRRRVVRFGAIGMRSLFDEAMAPEEDRRRLPAEIRQAIVTLKAEYPPFSLRELARIGRHRFTRPVDHHTVRRVRRREPLPINPPRRFPPYHAMADPVQRRLAVVRLAREGWGTRAIAGDLGIARSLVSETLDRWQHEGWPGLADRPTGPRQPARKVDLNAMAIIRRLQANPELGEFRIHAALAQPGIDRSPRTCGRILALHRAMGVAPRPTTAAAHNAQSMPFAAASRHHDWSVDIRSIEDHQLGTGKPVSVISILENFSRALLASVLSPRQDLTAYLIVLRAAVAAHGAPEILVSDSGSVFKAKQAQAIYRALGRRKEQIDAGQPWPNSIETHCNVMRRLADDHSARAATGTDLQGVHERFFHGDHQQAHFAHRARTDGRRSPAAVLGWVQGAWCEPADLDQLFRLRALRRLTAGGAGRFRHWRLYGERGLAGEHAAVWVAGEMLTIEYQTEALAQYRVAFETDGRRLREVKEPRLFATGHASPQPFLPALAELDWRPAQRLTPDRARHRPRGKARPVRLFADEGDQAVG